MSQICALIVFPSTWIDRVANSTPIVDLLSKLNSLRVNRERTARVPDGRGSEGAGAGRGTGWVRTYGYCARDGAGSARSARAGECNGDAPLSYARVSDEDDLYPTRAGRERGERDQHKPDKASTRVGTAGAHLEEVVVARVALRVASESVSVRVRASGALSEMRWLMERGRRRLAIACCVAGGSLCLRVRWW